MLSLVLFDQQSAVKVTRGYVRWRTVGGDREEDNTMIVLSTDSDLIKFLEGMLRIANSFRLKSQV